jgi:hypothetical protein
MRILVCVLLGACSAFAQTESKAVVFNGATGAVFTSGSIPSISATAVQGAPYTATVTNESIQTLADGNRIVHTSTGSMARDSMGRTRQDAPMPSTGNLSRANAPHMVFIRDPVAETSFTLNLTDKTAHKAPSRTELAAPPPPPAAGARATGLIALAPASQAQRYAVPRNLAYQGPEKPQIEDLGTQTMEGVLVTGTRTTHMIPAGEVGNDKPLSIVNEVWTSPELKTVVYSKRSDPRTGDQTVKLTNIVRAEPDPSLFAVPPDFKIDGEQ